MTFSQESPTRFGIVFLGEKQHEGLPITTLLHNYGAPPAMYVSFSDRAEMERYLHEYMLIKKAAADLVDQRLFDRANWLPWLDKCYAFMGDWTPSRVPLDIRRAMLDTETNLKQDVTTFPTPRPLS